MIQIKNPCDAKWQEMTPTETGKYCSACEKVVVDFSKMNDLQIKEYFTEYASQKTCGRFLTSQIDRPLDSATPNISSKFLKYVNRFPGFKSVVLIWASSVLWLTNCVNKDRVTGEADNQTCEPLIPADSISTFSNPDTIAKEQDSTLHKVGFIAPITKSNISVYSPDELIFLDSLLMGNICVEPDKPNILPITIPALTPDTSDTTIHVTVGKVKMIDTISQKIERKK